MKKLTEAEQNRIRNRVWYSRFKKLMVELRNKGYTWKQVKHISSLMYSAWDDGAFGSVTIAITASESKELAFKDVKAEFRRNN